MPVLDQKNKTTSVSGPPLCVGRNPALRNPSGNPLRWVGSTCRTSVVPHRSIYSQRALLDTDEVEPATAIGDEVYP